ncbi:lipoprotein [Vibrio sp. JCM 19236]|nr:lipoprotein [Vibrio sp. JCM 19236]
MQSEHGPRIIINASDITTGLRFSFIQEYFGLICSDAESYPVSKAVAASAAVPVLFEPVVLENLGGCQQDAYEQHLPENVSSLSYQSQQTMREIGEYSDKEKNKYIHLVDGGITDNLGLLAIYDLLELGQIHKFAHFQPSVNPHHVIVISVDASTNLMTPLVSALMCLLLSKHCSRLQIFNFIDITMPPKICLRSRWRGGQRRHRQIKSRLSLILSRLIFKALPI